MSKKQNTKFPCVYNIGGIVIKSVNELRYLGIKITRDLSWNDHINELSSKANRTLGLIKRTLHGCEQQVKELAFKSLVRPKLEYAASVWDPSSTSLIHLLEMVQRRGARFVSGIPLFTRDEYSITRLVSNLKWPSLAIRRKHRRLLMLHGAVHNTSSASLPLHRNLTFLPDGPNTRGRHSLSINSDYARTNVKRDSFLGKTVKEWNALTIETLSLGPKDFLNVIKAG